jgi:hypothetical protein
MRLCKGYARVMQGIVRRLRRLSDVIATFGAANATFGAAKFPVSYPSFVSETPKR